MLYITACTVYFFVDATASVKLDKKSLFNKKKCECCHFASVKNKINQKFPENNLFNFTSKLNGNVYSNF